MERWKKAALITIGIVLLSAGFVAVVLPGIVKSQAVQRVESATGRKLAIGGISINLLNFTIELNDCRFSEKGGGETFVSFSSARIAVSPASLYRMAPVIASAHVSSPQIRIVRGGANSYNFSDLLKWLPKHPRLSVNNLTITKGSLDFIDQGFPVEKRHELRNIELAVPFITTMAVFADRYVTPRLSLVLNGSPLHLEGKLRPFPRAVELSATVELKDISIPHYLAYLPEELPVRFESGKVSAKVAVNYRATQKQNPELSLKGSATVADLKVANLTGVPLIALNILDVAGNLELGGAEGLKVDNLSVKAQQVYAPFRKGEWISVVLLSLNGGKFNRKENLLEVADVTFKAGDFRFSRDRNGALLPLKLLYEGGKGSPDGKNVATPLLRYRIGRISGSEMNAVFTDEMHAERPSFAFKNIDFSLEKLVGPPFDPIPFKLAGKYGEVGSLSASGSVTPTPWKLKTEVAVQRIPLTDFNPYLSKNLKMVVAAGKFDALFDFSLATGGKRLTGSIGGSAGISSLYCLDADGEDFLKWDRLHLDKIKWDFAPFALDIGDVSVNRFYSRLIVAKDGIFNFRRLYAREPEEKEKQRAVVRKMSLFRIGTIAMQDGTLAFIDRHVAGGYSTTLNLDGRINGLSTEENRFADVDLRANLANRSHLKITGRINPLRNNLFTDLKISFTDIELPPMTPYSGTYLGYAVDKGQLSIHSGLRIENKKLDLENKLFIDQLQFGKRIESDKATSLPIRRAAAMLKDRKGEIHIDLPVTGRTDDPKFSAWSVALDILENIVIKAANVPIDLIRSIFDEEEEINGNELEQLPSP